MNGIHPDLLKQLKEYYKPGTKVKLLHMSDPFTTIPTGTIGVVSGVDDAGTIHTVWSNGSTLGAVFGEDYVEKIEEGGLE
jgi:hypothetical protein